MTKAEYIDFIRNSLPMVDKTSRFHYEQVAAAINLAVNSVFHELYTKSPKSVRKSLERYSTLSAKLTPTQNAAWRPRYRVTLSSDVVDLPKKTGGILEVLQWNEDGISPELNHIVSFVPVSTMEGEQLYGSESSLPGNVAGYSWLGNRTLELWGLSSANASLGVSVRYLQQFRSYASTDRILLPFGQEQAIIDKVREYLGATPPKDLVNDNADSNG
jgi:hypothetical protein